MEEESINIKLAHFHLQEAQKLLDECLAVVIELEQKLNERGKPSDEWSGEL
jgi:hypothetical protein